MRSAIFSLGALALGLVSAHEYPQCDTDNCYNNLIDARFAEDAKAFCPEFLAETNEDADSIPEKFGNCEDVKALSSACSCITYVPTTTAPPTTAAPTSTEAPETTEEPETSTEEEEEPTTAPTGSDIPSTTGKSTTSTVTATTTRTITDCAPTVTNCPARTTVETTVYTTVCPVTEEEPEPTKPPVESKTTIGTVTLPTTTSGPKPTTPIVPGAAGRAGVEGLAVVAGLIAAALL